MPLTRPSRRCRRLLFPGVLFFLAQTACSGPPAEQRVVAASVFPLASLTEMVVGERFPVVSLLPPGRSPHDYEPSPAELKRLRRAVLFLHTGGGMDEWMKRAAVGVTGNPAALFAVDEDPPSGRDPHVWLDLDVMMAFLPRLADRLAALDPEEAEGYHSRARLAVDSLRVFDDRARKQLAASSGVPFALLHPAFKTLTDRYALNCVAILERHPEGESSPRHLETVSHALQDSGALWIFAEPQLDQRGALSISVDTQAEVALLDPLGGRGVPGRETYLGLLHWNLEQLAGHLSGSPVPEHLPTPGAPE